MYCKKKFNNNNNDDDDVDECEKLKLNLKFTCMEKGKTRLEKVHTKKSVR